MKISVVGCGYLGGVHAAAMARLGHEVIGIDVDESKVALLGRGEPPFFEPGLTELLGEELAGGRLRFAADMAAANGCDVHFVCVGTPQKRGEYAADMKYVQAAVEALAPHLRAGDVVVGKSTVPVGTAARLAKLVAEVTPGAVLAWNPEFLREGHAIEDTVSPDRLVYGIPPGADGELARRRLDEVYASVLAEGTPLVVTDYPTAELVKAAANAFLATKISFINAMAEVCEASGADVTKLADSIGHDDRIGRKFLNSGLGFGGGCLPKDIRAFMARAGELGASDALGFLKEIDQINMRRRVAVLGAAFKPNSDDIRDSPALNVAAQMQLQGASVVVTDPKAIENGRRVWPDITFVPTAQDAAQGADVVLLLTEWSDYCELDPTEFGSLVNHRRMLDGRNALDPDAWRAAGWTYRALGRP